VVSPSCRRPQASHAARYGPHIRRAYSSPGRARGWSLAKFAGKGYSYQRCSHTCSSLCERNVRPIVTASHSSGILVGAHSAVRVANCARRNRLPVGCLAQLGFLAGSVENSLQINKQYAAFATARWAKDWVPMSPATATAVAASVRPVMVVVLLVSGK
jgi:hypothetical protein